VTVPNEPWSIFLVTLVVVSPGANAALGAQSHTMSNETLGAVDIGGGDIIVAMGFAV
jgi:hypothetical protein